jgi:putative restriction endonuclease
MCSSVFETFREFTLEIFGLRLVGFVLWFPLKLRKTFSMPKAKSVTWTREHFLVALNLYCKLPFGQYDRKNPIIIDVASRLGRTPSSLAMKLSNFASLDPIHQARGVKGLSGATKQDRVMWNEFRSDIEVLGAESEQLLHDLYTEDNDEEVDFLQRDNVRLEHSSVFLDLSRETEVVTVVKVRRGQQFFRQTVLNAYGIRCCITGINVPRLLVASHIKPWRDFPNERLQPRNGLCLSSLHDAAFDAGFITLDEQLRLVLSKRLKDYFPQPALEQSFVQYEGKPISKPNKIAEPDTALLEYHRDVIFKDR